MFQEEEGAGEGRQGEGQEELGVQRRKELNRIKKKYGLRVSGGGGVFCFVLCIVRNFEGPKISQIALVVTK